MTYIKINATQAAALRGNYGPLDALDPIALPGTSDYILTDAVLTDPAFASVRATIQAYPTYPLWVTAHVYSIGDIVDYGGKLWRNVQAHTSQANWTPPVVPALWTFAHLDGYIYEWIQPTGAQDSWPLNALVTHSGRTWKSLTAANVYTPGEIGTWRDQSVPPIWVAPAGSVGLWQVNDICSYNGHTWKSLVNSNSWEPGAVGTGSLWQQIG